MSSEGICASALTDCLRACRDRRPFLMYMNQSRQNQSIQKAKEFYFSLADTIACKCLGFEVQRSRIAWDQLINKKNRKKSQTYFRSKITYHLEQILNQSHFYQFHSIDKFGNNFWSIQDVVDHICCEIVIRKCGNQNPQIYSMVYKGGSPRHI